MAVYGTGDRHRMSMSFSRQIIQMGTSPRGLSLSQHIVVNHLPSPRTHTLIACRLRNINLMSIDYALRPHLRSRLTPSRRTWLWETLGLRRTGFSPVLSLLMSASSLVCVPRSLTVSLQHTDNALLPRILHVCNMHPRLRYWI